MGTPTALGQMPGTPQSATLDPLLQECRDAYKISEEQFRGSIEEGKETINLYHNRHYTEAQLQKLAENGQPAETFNVIKMMAHAMIGYMETQVNEIQINPRYMGSAVTALLLNDVTSFIFEQNDFETMNKKIKLDGLLTGLMVCYEEVVPTGRTDDYGRKLYETKISHIPSWQCRIDPMSMLDNYEDARYFHHFKWMPEKQVKKLFGEAVIDKMTEYYNFLDGDREADYDRQFTGREQGRYKQHDNYLIVKTIIEHEGKIWSVIWNDEFILEKVEVTFKKVRNPYRITKMSNSDKAEYYGPFRDITETQYAINQALLQIQLLVNTSKAFVEDNAVENIEEFRELFNRVNAVIEDMSRDTQAQYLLIDQALSRIKSVLGINDSFLGQAFASDSGRKVQMQAQSSGSQLTMVVDRVKFMFKMIGTDVVNLVQQFYTGEQVFRIAEPLNAEHYVQINKPIEQMHGYNEAGEAVTSLVWEEEIDPNTGEPMEDEDGAIMMTPLNDPDSAISFSEVDIKIVTSNAMNADERNQLLMETMSNGPAGQILMQTNPAAYCRSLAMQISEFGTKHSLEIARLLMETAIGIEQGSIDPRLAQVGGDLQAIMGAAMGGQAGGSQNMPSQGNSMPQQQSGPQSQTLGLPQAGGQ